METNVTKVYLVEEYSCIYGDEMRTVIGIYSSLDKAQVAYEEAKHKAECDLKPDESWVRVENTQSTDMYFEMMDDIDVPEKYYSLQLEEQPLL